MEPDAQPSRGKLMGRKGHGRSAGLSGRLDWPASLSKGRPRSLRDLLYRPGRACAPELWLVLLDASASTLRYGALSQAKGLLTQLFEQAYQARARLAVLQLSAGRVQWLWQGRKASADLHQWLAEQGAGGGTPLMEALQQAHGWLLRRQSLKPTEQQRLLILTDGRLRDWARLPSLPCPALLVDIECAPIRLGRARQLAAELGAEYWHIEALPKSR